MTPELPVPPPPPPPEKLQGFFDRDSIARGFFISVIIQIGIVIVTIPVALFLAWGITEWAALLPVYFMFRRRGQPLTAKGILIAGFIAVLLNATCSVVMLGNLKNLH
jgi:hypothetical protein